MIESKKYRRKGVTEHDEQVALFQWATVQKGKYPELANMFAIPNGGHRHISVARKLKAEGVKAGVPDVFLAAPKGRYSGLCIEMKVGYNTPTNEQSEWIEQLLKAGYACAVCWSAEDAAEIIVGYLNEK